MGIFLLILKIIGIILLVVILLVLLILAALLFAPFRYEIEADGDKDGPKVHALVTVRWLLRIVSFRFVFKKEDDPEKDESGYILRVFGIRVKNTVGKPGKDEDKEEAEEKTESGEAKEEAASGSAGKEEKPAEDETAVTLEDKDDADEAGQKPKEPEAEISQEKPKEESGTADSGSEAEGQEEETSSEASSETDSGTETESDDSEDKPKGKLKDKISGLVEKVQQKAESLLDSFEALFILLKKKKGLLAKYIRKKSTKEAIKTAWKTLLWVLKHIKPKKYRGSLTFGMEDPALTGEICAAISPWYPLISDTVSVTPVFENRLVAGGDVYLKGRIRLWGFVIRALKLYRDRNIRKVIKEAEQVKEKIVKTPDEVKELFTSAA